MTVTQQAEATEITNERTCDEEEEEETEEDTEEPEDIAEGEEDIEDEEGDDRGIPVKNRVRAAGREQSIELGTLNIRAQPSPSTQARGKYSRPHWQKLKRRNTISEDRVIPDSEEERVNKGEGSGHQSISNQPDTMPAIISSPLSSPPTTPTSSPAYLPMSTEVLPPLSRPSP
ncbi:hypothetical protein L873DRAFT_364227 [Choiromyces venosus 120613-1]|uniref:Uncharacterized protein n=1 Tax=Choiromyces venosus 120613-1 TaxID=1336337 RepID=A0A3N4K0J4_9PEZI|nr:hypothetical protein L873DRAFT_364227 [Choiromyces venosus 120613-1]